LILKRSNVLSIQKSTKKRARVHFIPDLKVRVFVTLRAPVVIRIKTLLKKKISTDIRFDRIISEVISLMTNIL
ncbi:MAG: hypothetical protein PHG79_02000, partial [Methanosarcina sp.]|nr:hypothetical protein [Methanosarcina sp.]MDD3874365.1 hypothetical protein [Methanosarcina sp.]MDD4521915.1 hypothetical protein [Methanosarcina sp.]